MPYIVGAMGAPGRSTAIEMATGPAGCAPRRANAIAATTPAPTTIPRLRIRTPPRRHILLDTNMTNPEPVNVTGGRPAGQHSAKERACVTIDLLH